MIKPRKNSIMNTMSEVRRCEVDLYRALGHQKWAEEKGHGRRCAVEIAYSTFKRVFGESVMTKTMQNAVKELVGRHQSTTCWCGCEQGKDEGNRWKCIQLLEKN